jgi:hypothetical protein
MFGGRKLRNLIYRYAFGNLIGVGHTGPVNVNLRLTDTELGGGYTLYVLFSSKEALSSSI